MKLSDYSNFCLIIIALVVGILAGNGGANPNYVPCLPGSGGDLRTSSPSILKVTVNTNDRMQKIHNFGASDAWSIQFVGQWPLSKRNAIADLLFETGLDINNDPKGIGLSLWRFNIGAGSSRQNTISDTWHRADTFLSSDFSSYDWTRLPGQRWFLQAAKSRGVEQFIAFVNSPPINMTKNGQAYCDSTSGTTNLANNMADDFAVYLVTILKHFRDVEGISFGYISPFNEPNWDWNGSSQEGCRYNNSDIKWVVDALFTELQSQALSTKIQLPEAGEISYLYDQSSARGNYIDSFFNASSSNYIANKVAWKIAGHSYFTCWPEWDDRLVGWREILRSKLNLYPGLEYWMTEYCIYIPNASWVPPQHRDYGNGRDLGIDPALWVARLIHYDLTVAGASAWQWWLAVSPYWYKDGLVYVDKSQSDGDYYESKMLWGMGNFSRFIRPEMERVIVYRSDNATPDDTVYDLMVSGYYKSDDGIVVVVFVNWAYEDKPIDLNFLGAEVTYLIPYVTRGYSLDKDNLTAYSALSPGDTIAIPARSIVTIVGLPKNRIDCNKDGIMNFGDFAILAEHWLQTHCAQCSGADLSGNGQVEFEDLAVFAENWLKDLGQAWGPTPANGATNQPKSILYWNAEETANVHDVYFGTDRTAVENADTSSPLYIDHVVETPGVQPCSTKAVTLQQASKTYYWRIDEVEADGITIHKGDVWSFTVMPLQAWDPSPTNGQALVTLAPTLYWNQGADAIASVVYFGTSSTSPTYKKFINHTLGQLRYNYVVTPTPLAYNTTYYWRIDQREPNNAILKGDVWSFTTVPNIPINDPTLLGWWKLDEGSGTTVLDWSGHNRHGTINGGATYATGVFDKALNLDGIDDWVSVGNRILYVDGVEAARDTQDAVAPSGGGLHIGAGKNLEAGTFWSGLIDDVRIYDRAVTP